MIKYTEPWEHLVVDGVYDENLFSDMISELLDHIRSGVSLKSMNYINDLSLFPSTMKCIQSQPITSEWIDEFSSHRKFDTLTPRHQIIICIGESKFEIHDEIPQKVLSAVTYVWPKTGTGTLIYDEDKNFVKEIEWKQNRTMMFCGMDNTTWHTYYSNANTVRITLNTFLER